MGIIMNELEITDEVRDRLRNLRHLRRKLELIEKKYHQVGDLEIECNELIEKLNK